MSRAWPILKDLSICLRCQYRQGLHRRPTFLPNQAYVRRHLRYFTSSFPLAAQQQEAVHADDTSYDDSIHETYEPHDGPIITYEPTDAPTAAQRHARRHSLGLEVLGKPAEILVLQHEEDSPKQDLFYIEKPDTDPIETSPLSPADLVDAVTEERGIIGEEQVCQNIDELRRSVLGDDHLTRGSVSDSAFHDLVSKLRRGFTAKQLQAYFVRTVRASEGDPMNLWQDYASHLCSRSSWREGTTSLSYHRAPDILESDSPTESTSHGTQILKNARSKDELVDYMVRKYWQIRPAGEDNVHGEVDIRLQPSHFDLVLNHRKNIIKKTAETYGVKIDVSRPERIIRVTSDFDACGDTYRLFEYMTRDIRQESVNLPRSKYRLLTRSIREALIKEIEKLTSTAIKEVPVSMKKPKKNLFTKLEIHYLGPDTTDAEDAKRTLFSLVKSGEIRDQKIIWADILDPKTLIVSPVDIGTALPIKDRHIQWSRLCVPDAQKHRFKDGSLKDGHLSGKIKLGVLEAVVELFKGNESSLLSHATQQPTITTQFWEPHRSVESTVKLGQIIFPRDITQPTEKKGSLIRLRRTPNQATQTPVFMNRSRREFLTTVPGLHRTLAALSPPFSPKLETLHITLTPDHPPSLTADLRGFLPSLHLNLSLSPNSPLPQLQSAHFLASTTSLDVLLPSLRTDARLSHTVTVSNIPEQMDPAIQDFVDNSELNLQGTERLRTPSTLTLRVPHHALGQHKEGMVNRNAQLDLPEGIEVAFTFESLEHRSSITAPFEMGTWVKYEIIEAGMAQGRREELTVRNADMIPSDREQLVRRSLQDWSRTKNLRGQKGLTIRDAEEARARLLWDAAGKLLRLSEV